MANTPKPAAGAQTGEGAGASNTEAGAGAPQGATEGSKTPPEAAGAAQAARPGAKAPPGAQERAGKGTGARPAAQGGPAEGGEKQPVDARRNGGVLLDATVSLLNRWLEERPVTIEAEGAVVAVTRIDPERFTLHGLSNNKPTVVEQPQPEHVTAVIKKLVAGRQGIV